MCINWITQDHHGDAIAQAQAFDKPLMIYFHSASCSGCRRLVSEVLFNTCVIVEMTRWVIPVWVEVEQDCANERVSSLVGSHIFINSPVVQLVTADGDIIHEFAGTPLHTRLDLGYTRVHHDMPGDIDVPRFIAELQLAMGKYMLSKRKLAQVSPILQPLADTGTDAHVRQEAAYWLTVARNAGRYPEDARPQSALPALTDIANEVRRFCGLLCRIDDAELMLDWPGQRGNGDWTHYTDCPREVALGVLQTLLDVAHVATYQRMQQGRPLTQGQLILKEWHVAFRTLQGILHGLKASEWDRQHLHQNYSLGKQRTIRNNVVHCVMAEFWAHGSAILKARKEYAGEIDEALALVQSTWQRYGPPPQSYGELDQLYCIWEERHQTLIEILSSINDDELDFQSSWWEESAVSIRFRINRLGWHLQDHAAVIETICERIGRVRTETERLAQRIYHALGCAEGAMVGLPDEVRRTLFADTVVQLRAKGDELKSLYGADGRALRRLER